MQQRTGTHDTSSDSCGDRDVPDGWFRIAPTMHDARSNNVHPLTPPGAVRQLPSATASTASSSLGTHKQRSPPRIAIKSEHGGGHDSLGLARAVNPMRMLLRETRLKEQLQRAASCVSGSGEKSGPSAAAVQRGARESQPLARSSPRHLKLLRTHTMTTMTTAAAAAPVRSDAVGARDAHRVAEAFSPQRSLRLASLCKQAHLADARADATLPPPLRDERALSTSSPPLEPPLHMPLHELIQTVDEAVDADPRAASSQASVTHAFMEQWLAQYDASRQAFKSVAVHAEVGLRELARLTANVPSPNEFTTVFVCKVLQDLAPHFGAYAPLLHVLHAELHLSVYSCAHDPPLPYFAAVRHQKQLVLALRRDKKRKHARNDCLAREIVQVHGMFLHFLDECSSGLVRTLLREWYSIAVVRKKNSKKYIEYYSAWFTGSVKSLVPKLFATWKHATVQSKVDKMQSQLTADGEKLAALQRQVDELSVQRDVAQVESLAIRNDRKQAEDFIQRLNRKIQSAGTYLEGSYRRESIVCQEGQLRVEATSFLPPLVLESLLRAYHNVGFVQQLHSEFIPKQAAVAPSVSGAPGDTTAAAMSSRAAAPQRKTSRLSSSAGEDSVLALPRVPAALGAPDTDNTSTSVSSGDLSPLLTAAAAAAETPAAPFKPLEPPSKYTVLQECLAEIVKLRSAAPPPPTAPARALACKVSDMSAHTSSQQPSLPTLPPELSMQRFARLFQSIQQRMDDKGVNVIFTRMAAAASTRASSVSCVMTEAIGEEDDGERENEANGRADEHNGNGDSETCSSRSASAHNLREIAREIASLYEQTLTAIRVQDEHYARNAKLFSSRMLESHEVTVVPTHLMTNPAAAAAAIGIGVDDSSDSSGTKSQLDASSLASAPSTVVLQSGDLGVINGARRFSVANVCPVKMTALQFDKRALAMNKGKPASRTSASTTPLAPVIAAGAPSNGALERLKFMCWSDFDISPRHARAFFMLFLAHLASEFGSLLFSPADMSAFLHNAYVREAPAAVVGLTPAVDGDSTLAATSGTAVVSSATPGDSSRDVATVGESRDQGFHNIVTAYEAWNRLASQMIDAEIVQFRGGTSVPSDRPITAEIVEAAARRASSANGGVVGIRPKLQLHIEPLPQGILMAAAKERDGSNNSSTSHTRLSLTLGDTFHTARIRRLSIDDTVLLTQCVENVHRVVQTMSTRLQDFNVVRQQIREFRHLQWEQASELASQFVMSASVSPPSSAGPLSGAVNSATTTAADTPASAVAHTASTNTAPPPSVSGVFSASRLNDERKHVFECVTFANPVIERIFSIEDNPVEELERVRQTLESKKHLVRHLYTKHRPQIQHAVSLDELWHYVKALRFPKEIHMLPAMRDEDMAANGFEQLFSPDDLTEILLQLCNEQFLPQITPLSARVELFTKHHLPFAVQNQSIIRDLMHQQDVKRALADHSQTLRIIFRRYCAKERDVGLLSQQHHGVGGIGGAKSGHSQQQQHRPVRHIGHGISKYMRLIDWLAFIQDYNLLRPRFPLDYAVVVFRNVQEVVSSSPSLPLGDDSAAVADEQLEMIYSEFCEALVGVAACYFPDPFLKSATKVSQFVQRFLPVSPEEVSSHAKS